jgi:hypothetical protein
MVHDPAQEQEVTVACKWLNQAKEAGRPASIRRAALQFDVKYHILHSRDGI